MSEIIEAQVERVFPLTDSILQLILKPDQYVDYQAGQYLQILLGDEAFSYSIANAPLGSHTYELHIKHSRENPYNQSLLDDIKKKGVVKLRVPLGQCYLKQLRPEKPIIFIAAGTGFAPIKAMIEQLLAVGAPRLFELYWGARSQSDLYMDEKVTHWQSHIAQFQYFSHLTATSEETLAARVYKRHKTDLDDWQFVMGGPFEMIYGARDFLTAHGARNDMMFSDAFSFENLKNKE